MHGHSNFVLTALKQFFKFCIFSPTTKNQRLQFSSIEVDLVAMSRKCIVFSDFQRRIHIKQQVIE